MRIPTVGSMEGSYAAFLVTGACKKEKDTSLFIDPGFPVQKQQMMVMNQKFLSFDIYDFRGEKLREKLESFLSKGNICNIIYSNPNNPSWVCLTEEELKIIGELADKYDTAVIEDLAYFAMDFRQDLSKPGIPPYQPTVARYTDNWIMMISSSKVSPMPVNESEFWSSLTSYTNATFQILMNVFMFMALEMLLYTGCYMR